MDNKKNFLELKDKYFETARKRIEGLEKSIDTDKLKEVEKLQWGLFRKELLELEEYYLKWEPNGSSLSVCLDEFEPFQKKLIDIRIKSGQKGIWTKRGK
jgi:hypothetical protein